MEVSKPPLPVQPSLFVQPDPIRSELKTIKIDKLTPLEALNVLDELKKKAETEDWVTKVTKLPKVPRIQNVLGVQNFLYNFCHFRHLNVTLAHFRAF